VVDLFGVKKYLQFTSRVFPVLSLKAVVKSSNPAFAAAILRLLIVSTRVRKENVVRLMGHFGLKYLKG
jgi:hypothetical protein